MDIIHPIGQDVSSGDGAKTIDWLIKQIKEGDTFIDCGAHMGFICVPVMNEVYPKKSILIEASPLACKYLRQNVARFRNVKIVNKVVSNKVGTEIYRGGDDPAHGSVFYGSDKEEIESTTIDQIVKDFKIKGDIVMKMDIELSEPRAWEGMVDCLPQIKAVNMEFMPTRLKEDAGVDPQEFIRTIEKKGFEIQDYKGNPFDRKELYRDDYKWDICIVRK